MKIKSILTLTMMGLLASPSWAPAAPVLDEPIQVQQPGAASFTIHPKGDEWSSWDETDDGYSVVRDKTSGAWHYAKKNAQGKLESSGALVGRDDPKAFGLSKHQRPNRAPESSSEPAPGSDGTTASAPAVEQAMIAPTTGDVPTVFILVEFNDKIHTYTDASFSTFLTDKLGAYYNEASYGRSKTVPAFETSGTANDGTVGWLLLNQNHPDTRDVTSSTLVKEMVRDAIVAADSYIDYASYDINHDGYVDATELAVVVIPAGYETSSGGTSCSGIPSVWGHKGSLSSTYYPTVDGVIVGASHSGKGGYGMFGEVHGYGGRCTTSTPDHQATLGIMAHELGHLIYRWIDLYDTDYSSQGIGKFSLMAGGTWASQSGQFSGETPVHPDAYHKVFSGWVDPVTDTLGAFTLPAAGSTSANSANAVQMQTTSNPQEYFLIENRSQYGYDRGLYRVGSATGGIAVFHVDESKTGNTDESHKKVDLEEADNDLCMDTTGTSSCSGKPTHLFYSGNSTATGTVGGTVFDGATTPNSNLYDGTATNVALNNVGVKAESMNGHFGPFQYNLAVSNGGNGSVTSSPSGINCGVTCSASFAEGGIVTLTATPDSGYNFGGWTGACTGTAGCTVTMNSAKSVTATFQQATYTVTPSAGAGGSIDPNVAQTVNSGSTVSFTVTPNIGYHIASVTGCSGMLSGTTYTTGTISANCDVTASFAIDTYTVTPSAGTGGSISPNVAQTVNSGNTVNFTVTPDTGYHIDSVTGCNGALTGTTYTTGTITANCGVTASFAIDTYTVTPSAGTGGSISPNVAQTVNSGNTVNFTVTPNTGYHIDTVTGCNGALSGNTYTTGTITTNCPVTASFAIDTYTYALTVDKSGSGSVTSGDGSINCGTTCSAIYNGGTSVTLTAAPNAGNTFSGWSGACAGTGSCTVTMDAAKNVSATFAADQSTAYNFSGFFPPVDNPPVLNQVNAGKGIPVKFSLGGDQGLDIMASGYPGSGTVACDASAPVDTVEQTVTAGSSGLSYDASTGQYTYVWKTNATWKGQCRQLVVKLKDGSVHWANFKFK